jgi:hypothetical protein
VILARVIGLPKDLTPEVLEGIINDFIEAEQPLSLSVQFDPALFMLIIIYEK